jgi:prepilin-type processing-associated H-X9-DG protein
MPLYECPTARKQRTIAEDDFGLTDYAALVGEEAAFPLERGIKARDFADGTSNTLMVVEAVGTGIRWAEPRDIYVPFANMIIRSQKSHQDQLNPLISSAHTGGGHVLMADGTVRFISSSVSPEILKQLTTRAAGDVVSDDF